LDGGPTVPLMTCVAMRGIGSSHRQVPAPNGIGLKSNPSRRSKSTQRSASTRWPRYGARQKMFAATMEVSSLQT
jgi:hypothetical protein